MNNRLWPIVLLSLMTLSACAGGGKPSVDISKPQDGTVVDEGSQVQIEAGAVGGGQIERVELFIDDTLIATYDNPHLSVALKASFTWQASGVGRHIIKVVAINDDGVASDPASISIEVK